MKRCFELFTCLGLLSLLLIGCGTGVGGTEPPVEPPAHGHTWADPTYTWAEDYSSCTAERVCLNDSSHKEKETVNSTYAVVTEPTEESEGLCRYTATFTKTAFVTQTHDIALDKLEPSYHGETPIMSEDGKTISYGLYPQTNVSDSTLVSTLNTLTTPESNGWYLYKGEYYAKVNATPYNTNYKFDNGTTIVSGTTYWFKCKPIVWNVLSNSSGEYYIISSVLLDVHCYYNSTSSRTIDGQRVYANNYEYSEIRAWLNDEFYNSAFALGNSNIQLTNVDNSVADWSDNPYTCNNTQDKVFLLSLRDYENSSYGFSKSYSIPDDARSCKTTDWARARGALCATNSGPYQYNGFYLTRSPYFWYSFLVYFVADNGQLLEPGSVDFVGASVRPGLSIKIANL